MKKLSFLLVLLMLFVAACDPIQNPDDSNKTSADIQSPYYDANGEMMTFNKKPPFNSDFFLRLDEEENEVYLPGNVAVKLTRIKDMRCPIGNECNRAGSVQVVLEIDLVGEDPYEEILFLGGGLEDPSFLEFYGTTHLTLIAVEPVSTSEKTVKAEDQVVIFAVTRNPIK
jgi:hypothetical protein